ncbi:MAG: c-type cytochrome, partial [Anaerolineales bacterium]|nr:c-type cytochrome [Anaerolineales bacterium]
PPSNYVAPTAVPTLGALYPVNAPDVVNGKIIFAEKCAPCHGDGGLGDGEQGKQLPVSVIPIGLPEIAQQASPAKWYRTVTQGNIDRFMPPFASLNDQERWDVVAYALTLHTTSEQIQIGKNLFESNCTNCENQFTNLEEMSAVSDSDLVKQIKDSFGNKFTDEESFAVAAYIRTLTFAPQSTVTIDSTAQAESTPEATEQTEITDEASEANITGQIENQSGQDLPSDLQITLRGFQHGADPNAGTQEFFNQASLLNEDGSYGFENEIAEGQIYFVQFEWNGLNYQSSISVVPIDATQLTLPTLIIYETTQDFSALRIDSLEIFFDLAGEDSAQVFSVYTFTNASDKTIIINLDNETVPFIAFPNGASGLGYEATQDSATFIPTENGFAIPPNETPYGLIAFASIPKSKEIQFSQPALLDINEATILLPEGVTAEGNILTDKGIQPIQNTNFHIYTAGKTIKGNNLEFTLSGKPKGTDETANPFENQNVIIGIGAFGVALIFAGVWMFLKDKNKEDVEEDDFDDSESIMDAIIALDDLHKDGKISDTAYQKRRNELKNKLRK